MLPEKDIIGRIEMEEMLRCFFFFLTLLYKVFGVAHRDAEEEAIE